MTYILGCVCLNTLINDLHFRLCEEHISVFDPKINSQHTQECLKRLLNFYKESATTNHNQVEFESIYLLFNLGEYDALKHFLSLDKQLR